MKIEFIIDPITSPWNPNISDQNMHFIDTQTFLRRFIKIILTINCFNQIVINRKNKAYDNYKALLEDIMTANNSHNLCNFITISVDTSRIKDTHTENPSISVSDYTESKTTHDCTTFFNLYSSDIHCDNQKYFDETENYALNLMDNTASSINDIKTACCNTMSCRDHNLQNLDAFSTSNENAKIVI